MYLCGMKDKKPVISIITGTRADWGLLSPIARRLRDAHAGEVAVEIIATNMHLQETFGMTVKEIEADGFAPLRVPMKTEGTDEASRACALAECTAGMAEAFNKLKPDVAVILGDRYEMLGAASAAALMHIPIVHLHGGEITEGAVDDSIRHAITKLSDLHLTATDDYRRRVIQMGEDPARVLATGAIGVYNALNTPFMSKDEVEARLNLKIQEPLAVITYHPATLDSEASPGRRFDELLKALEEHPELQCIITYPNNDAHSAEIITRLEKAAGHNSRLHVFRSLGARLYLSLLSMASLCIGNSSSGIIEAPSFGIPTVDIGIRQRGRTAADSVIHCGDGAWEISEAISRALAFGKRTDILNPYFRDDTLGLITRAIADFALNPPAGPKRFHDIA